MSRRLNWRRVKHHRSYTIMEAALLLGVSRLTVQRWFKHGLPALREKRPTLILRRDLAEFLRARSKSKTRLGFHEMFCFRCRCPRTPAGQMVDYRPRTSLTGTMSGLCEVCTAVMHKAVAASQLVDLRQIFDVSLPQGETHLSEMNKTLLNDHFRQEPHA